MMYLLFQTPELLGEWAKVDDRKDQDAFKKQGIDKYMLIAN